MRHAIHTRLGRVFDEEEFSDATFLSLSPYSFMLNYIENVWSSMKARVKTLIRERLAAFLGPPSDGATREEFRMQYLEHIAEQVIQVVDVNRLHQYARHLEAAYARAENMDDVLVGA
ncbi:hypothetical protein AaE_014099 [Aphanomyces astaci]|uniref:Tc1-like transposase DDE domain-containing protein n=1 Tax=Aphanomyces astaci TaxID=112090 RepID=A0A6A4Z814_APHAT|nr:hypothetical protein AaE_014099 [Aphanomyces astaci]